MTQCETPAAAAAAAAAVLFMSDLSPSWKVETISLLIDKVLVVVQGAEEAEDSDPKKNGSIIPPEHVGVTKIVQNGGVQAVAKLVFASVLECQQVQESYQGLAIPHTHGYHHYRFHKSWPPPTTPQPQSATDDNKKRIKRQDDGDEEQQLTSENDDKLLVLPLLQVPSPPLHLQLMVVPHKELRRRLSTSKHNGQTMDQFLKSQHQQCKVWIHCFLVHTFMNSILKGVPPRRPCHSQAGVLVPKEWTDRLWQTLAKIPTASDVVANNNNSSKRQLSWPPISKQRKGVQSSHYLTIRKQHPPHQDAIWQLCHDLFRSTIGDEDDQKAANCFNALAITKNFMGSPHIDAHDQTYQHVIAVGNFVGGQLCCELDQDGKEELQIDIHNKLGRMDGRKVHWVNGWHGTERYSVVYYSTNKADWTSPDGTHPQLHHVRWMQEKNQEKKTHGTTAVN